jgi:hypothetical protein
MMLRLADTSIRLYRRKDGRASLHLRSYLMVQTDASFRLNTYLKEISAQLRLPTGPVIQFDRVAFSDALTCKYALNTMVHDFWASAVAQLPTLTDQVGILRVDYHLSFTGHPSETPTFFELVVPLIKRATPY